MKSWVHFIVVRIRVALRDLQSQKKINFIELFSVALMMFPCNFCIVNEMFFVPYAIKSFIFMLPSLFT